MAKLYELTESYNNLLDLVDNLEIPVEMIKESLDSIGEQIEVKAENIAKVIKSIEVDVKGLKEEEKRLAERRKSLENSVRGLKKYTEDSMKEVGIKKIKGKVFTLGIQKNAPSIQITAEEDIPKEFFILEKRVVKKDILVALKQGKEVPGVAIKQTESLRIR